MASNLFILIYLKVNYAFSILKMANFGDINGLW